jgi:hypothetical protein
MPVTAEDVFAGDVTLRGTLAGFGLAAAERGGVLRIVSSPAGPASLYTAAGPEVVSWATHAVAAGFLAHGSVAVDREAIAELVTYDFVGTTRSPIAGVKRVPLASRIDIHHERHALETYWPAAERWAPVPETSAYEHTERALLDSLARRAGSGRVGLALTAGADSRVLALALRQLAVPASAFIWGDDHWPEVEGARRVADHLGISLRTGTSWRDDGELKAVFDRDVRATDGTLIIAPSERTWPDDVDAVLLGTAGEVGRAFYYGKVAARAEPQTDEALADVLDRGQRLAGASKDVHALIRATVMDWVREARKSGLDGWRLLDVLYAEQRVACWGRSQMPPLGVDLLAGFAPQEVVRGLASLPLADRLTDGFHRRFVAERAPELSLGTPPRRPVAPSMVQRVRRKLGIRRPPRRGPLMKSAWDERPVTQAWIADEVLRSPLVTELFGLPWAERVRDEFVNGYRPGTSQAVALCGPVALADALLELAQDRR